MDVVREKKLLYVDAIMDIAKSKVDDKEKRNILSGLLAKYYKYCYDNGIENCDSEVYDKGFNDLGNYSYIFECRPDIFNVDEAKTLNAVNHLKEALENNRGISEEEAKQLLDWSVQKARTILDKDCYFGIMEDSLEGLCGISQMLTLAPFLEIGAKVTINNAYKFGDKVGNHAFGTVSFPIEKEGRIIEKQYLIDASYRQFFTTARCNYGRYYDLNKTSGPDAGYYVNRFPNGDVVAKQILEKGYTELTDEALEMYGGSFLMSRLNINTKDDSVSINTEILREIVNTKQVELDFDKDEIKEYSKVISFPSKSSKAK